VGRPRLVGITKRGNSYLRRLLTHGARAALPRLVASETQLDAWLQGLLGRTTRTPCGRESPAIIPMRRRRSAWS